MLRAGTGLRTDFRGGSLYSKARRMDGPDGRGEEEVVGEGFLDGTPSRLKGWDGSRVVKAG